MARSSFRVTLDVAAWAFLAWIILRKIQFHFFPYKQALVRYRREPRAYAIITGASAGIGFGFAQELVAHGFGVILIASRKERLEAAAQALMSEDTDAVVKTIVYDAKNANGEDLLTALKPVLELPITVLINNVGGFSLESPFTPLAAYPAEHVVYTINMNAAFMAQLTRIMIPVLDRNGPSVVLSMGSAGDNGGPWAVLHSASKAFVRSFAVGVAREAKGLGLKINSLAIVVGQVQSEFVKKAFIPGSPTSRQYAKIVLDRVESAVDRRMWVVSPYWAHALQAEVIRQMPEILFEYLGNVGVKKMIEITAKEK